MEPIRKPDLDKSIIRTPAHLKHMLEHGDINTYDAMQMMGNTVNASADEVNRATDWVNKNGKILAENEEERIENEKERNEAEKSRVGKFADALNSVLLVTPEQAEAVIELTETVRENIDKVKEDADKSQSNAEVAEAKATLAEKSAREANDAAQKAERYDRDIKDTLEEIKGSGDVPAATVAQVVENTADINRLNLDVEGYFIRGKILSSGWNECIPYNLHEGDVIVVLASDSITFVTTNTESSHEISDRIISKSISANTETQITSPNDSRYVWINANRGNTTVSVRYSKNIKDDIKGIKDAVYDKDKGLVAIDKTLGTIANYIQHIGCDIIVNKIIDDPENKLIKRLKKVVMSDNQYYKVFKYDISGLKEVNVNSSYVRKNYAISGVVTDENDNVLDILKYQGDEKSINVTFGNYINAKYLYWNYNASDVNKDGIVDVTHLMSSDNYSAEISSYVGATRYENRNLFAIGIQGLSSYSESSGLDEDNIYQFNNNGFVSAPIVVSAPKYYISNIKLRQSTDQYPFVSIIEKIRDANGVRFNTLYADSTSNIQEVNGKTIYTPSENAVEFQVSSTTSYPNIFISDKQYAESEFYLTESRLSVLQTKMPDPMYMLKRFDTPYDVDGLLESLFADKNLSEQSIAQFLRHKRMEYQGKILFGQCRMFDDGYNSITGQKWNAVTLKNSINIVNGRAIAKPLNTFSLKSDIYDFTGSNGMVYQADLRYAIGTYYENDPDESSRRNKNYYTVSIINNIKKFKSETNNGVIVAVAPIPTYKYDEYDEKIPFSQPYVKDGVTMDLPSLILTAGTEEREWYTGILDELCAIFNNCVDERGVKIPIIYRPCHEMGAHWWSQEGSRFTTTENAINLFRFTVDYVRSRCNNVMIIYTINDYDMDKLIRLYPGNEYAEYVGVSAYGIDYDIIGKAISGMCNFADVHNLVPTIIEIAANVNSGIRGYTEENYWMKIFKMIHKYGIRTPIISTWINDKNYYCIVSDADFNKFIKQTTFN